MKKLGFVSIACVGLVASLNVHAATTTICDGTAAHSGAVPASGTAGSNFMVNAIAPKCSANVFLSGMDGTNGAWYAVGSASSKGKNTFKGSTNGGSVARHADCAIPGGCTATEANTARDAANTAAGSSS